MCTGETPENATVKVQCNELGIIFNRTYRLELADVSVNITESISVPRFHNCSLIVVFSNEAGKSEPLVEMFG